MKLELNFNWAWFLHKVRILFLIGIFYVLYTYTQPVFAFMWIIYFILNDLTEIVIDVDNIKTEKEEQNRHLRSMTAKRKSF